MFVVNLCTVTPVRQKPSESSEQLTQLLFGEICELLDIPIFGGSNEGHVGGNIHAYNTGYVPVKIIGK